MDYYSEEAVKARMKRDNMIGTIAVVISIPALIWAVIGFIFCLHPIPYPPEHGLLSLPKAEAEALAQASTPCWCKYFRARRTS